jgi:hypothetical protein
MLRVSLLAMGGSSWIAGVQYLHSLLYGNSLLPLKEEASLRLYLDFQQHRISDYRTMRTLSAGAHVTDFCPARSLLSYRRLRKIASTIVRQHRWPRMVMLDLPRWLRKNHTDVLFCRTHRTDIKGDLGVPQICWIPGFQHVYRAEFFSVEELQNRGRRFEQNMAEADRVIVSTYCCYRDAARVVHENTSHRA